MQGRGLQPHSNGHSGGGGAHGGHGGRSSHEQGGREEAEGEEATGRGGDDGRREEVWGTGTTAWRFWGADADPEEYEARWRTLLQPISWGRNGKLAIEGGLEDAVANSLTNKHNIDIKNYVNPLTI